MIKIREWGVGGLSTTQCLTHQCGNDYLTLHDEITLQMNP